MATPSTEWSNAEVLEFIELYQGEPALWDSTNKLHKNRNALADAWERIRASFSLSGVTIAELKRKKESLMTQGLTQTDQTHLEQHLTRSEIVYIKQPNFVEVDSLGVRVLNILTGTQFGYRIVGQSMIVEASNIGGRTVQVQHTTWTLGRED